MMDEKLLHPKVTQAFYGKFKKLHKIQIDVITLLMNGKNLVLSARTGLGKTEAVIVPLLSRYYKNAIDQNTIIILYISPTKALVNDIERRLSTPLINIGLKLGIRHGDRDDLRTGKPPHVLITTPESLDVLLFRGDAALNNVRAIVIDEIHILYNTQRGLHLSILIMRLKQIIKHKIQLVALSATIRNPMYIRDFLFGAENDTEFLQDKTCREIDAQIRIINSLRDIRKLFIRLMEVPRKFLVFANSRRDCEHIAECLTADEFLAPLVFAHYSSLSLEVREEVEKLFNNSTRAICIATSTLELGIDIGNIDAVLLYGLPSGVESFMQRIGRSNRRTNKTNVICLVRPDSKNPNLEALSFHALIELARKSNLPDRSPFRLFGSSVQQILSYIGSHKGQFRRTAELAKISAHIPHLNDRTLEKILGSLVIMDYLIPHGFKNRFAAGQKLYNLIDYRMIYGNFPINSQQITIMHGKRLLGHIPQINLLRVKSGDIILFAGKSWLIKNAKSEGILVEQTRKKQQVVDILYSGSGILLDEFVMSTMWEIIHRKQFECDLYAITTQDKVVTFVQSIEKLTAINSIPYCKNPEGYTYLTFAGKSINRAIALIANQSYFKASDILLSCINPIDWNSIPVNPLDYESIFPELFKSKIEQTFYQTLLPEELQRIEYLQSWLHDSTISFQLKRLHKSIPHEIIPEQFEKWGFCH